MAYSLPVPKGKKDQRRFCGLMITVLRTALFREIKVCLIGRNGRACSQSFYQENILIIKTFCPFVLLSKIIIVLLLLCLKTCSSVENSAFREMNGKSTGYLRDMFKQHIPLVKSFTHRHFKKITGYVGEKTICFSNINVHPAISYIPLKIPPLFLAYFQIIPYLCH